ncbi:MAG: hypothetical protein DVB25_06745 [Verrucomicrobia bacterium]|nr:MAG: hypothetical protein DVB25_06745 [Verrucomicrobiota bacterium]
MPAEHRAMFALLRCLALCLAITSAGAAPSEPAGATDATPAAAPATGGVEPAKGQAVFVQLDENRLKIGEVELNKHSRLIHFPAVFNQRDGLLEYVIVHDKGKVHESLLRTSINATHLNIALKLLGFESSRELFPLRDEEGGGDGLMPVVPPAVKAAARVEIRLQWKDGGTAHSATVNECIKNTKNDKVMAAGPWIYGGSAVHEGRFVAEMTGDIVAILTNEAAIFNFPGDSNKVGENYGDWFVLTKVVPTIGTPVTVQIGPWPPATAAAGQPRPEAAKP